MEHDSSILGHREKGLNLQNIFETLNKRKKKLEKFQASRELTQLEAKQFEEVKGQLDSFNAKCNRFIKTRKNGPGKFMVDEYVRWCIENQIPDGDSSRLKTQGVDNNIENDKGMNDILNRDTNRSGGGRILLDDIGSIERMDGGKIVSTTMKGINEIRSVNNTFMNSDSSRIGNTGSIGIPSRIPLVNDGRMGVNGGSLSNDGRIMYSNIGLNNDGRPVTNNMSIDSRMGTNNNVGMDGRIGINNTFNTENKMGINNIMGLDNRFVSTGGDSRMINNNDGRMQHNNKTIGAEGRIIPNNPGMHVDNRMMPINGKMGTDPRFMGVSSSITSPITRFTDNAISHNVDRNSDSRSVTSNGLSHERMGETMATPHDNRSMSSDTTRANIPENRMMNMDGRNIYNDRNMYFEKSNLVNDIVSHDNMQSTKVDPRMSNGHGFQHGSQRYSQEASSSNYPQMNQPYTVQYNNSGMHQYSTPGNFNQMKYIDDNPNNMSYGKHFNPMTPNMYQPNMVSRPEFQMQYHQNNSIYTQDPQNRYIRGMVPNSQSYAAPGQFNSNGTSNHPYVQGNYPIYDQNTGRSYMNNDYRSDMHSRLEFPQESLPSTMYQPDINYNVQRSTNSVPYNPRRDEYNIHNRLNIPQDLNCNNDGSNPHHGSPQVVAARRRNGPTPQQEINERNTNQPQFRDYGSSNGTGTKYYHSGKSTQKSVNYTGNFDSNPPSGNTIGSYKTVQRSSAGFSTNNPTSSQSVGINGRKTSQIDFNTSVGSFNPMGNPYQGRASKYVAKNPVNNNYRLEYADNGADPTNSQTRSSLFTSGPQKVPYERSNRKSYPTQNLSVITPTSPNDNIKFPKKPSPKEDELSRGYDKSSDSKYNNIPKITIKLDSVDHIDNIKRCKLNDLLGDEELNVVDKEDVTNTILNHLDTVMHDVLLKLIENQTTHISPKDILEIFNSTANLTSSECSSNDIFTK